eukprot:gene14967-14260_t
MLFSVRRLSVRARDAVIAALCAGGGGEHGHLFGLVALALRALPAELLTVPLVRPLTALLAAGAGVPRGDVLTHLLIGPGGLALWAPAGVVDWFRKSVESVAAVVDAAREHYAAAPNE